MICTLVDPIDSDLLSGSLFLRNGYVRRSRRRESNSSLHRDIVARIEGRPLVSSEQVDHINGDKLDNRRANLRLVTASANNQNRRGANKNSKSGVRGVSMHACGYWRVVVRKVEIGYFKDLQTAAIAAEQARAAFGFASGACHTKSIS